MRFLKVIYSVCLFLSTFAFAQSGQHVIESRTSYSNIDVQSIQAWQSYEQVEKYFFLIRDARFIEDPQHQGVYRRISWMYPDYGCNPRAFFAIEYLKQYKDLPLPNKIFIFDIVESLSFSVDTPFSKRGHVNWNDHVALAVRVEDQVYILDPAIELTHPLELDEWIARMTEDVSKKSFSVCHHDAFEPWSLCYEPEYVVKKATKHQNICLRKERKRVEKLGMDPTEVLGDTPPWK